MSSKTSNFHPGGTLDNLPKSFVSSLRVLFDILDEEGRGVVLLSDIESRWKGDGIPELPSGVLDCLRKVSPKNGSLSFERFCAGLKIALLRSRSDSNLKRDFRPRTSTGVNNVPPKFHRNSKQKPYACEQKVSHLERHLKNGDKNLITEQPQQRNEKHLETFNAPASKNNIVYTLRNWQKEQLLKSAGNRDPGDGRPANAENPPIIREEARRDNASSKIGRSYEAPTSTSNLIKKQPKHRREARRHTVANGIDYNMLKKMKELEQEKDILLQGMEVVERAREWYQTQIVAIQDRQKYFNRDHTENDLPVESYADRLKFQKARIFESNRQLSALMESSAKNFLPHMNLAIDSHSEPNPEKDAMIKALKEQNRQLTQEVSKRSEKVTQLEREKQALIRELFESRAKNQPRDLADNSTFM
ncbi:LOW QUALITY PROTEIN: suppressor APC domain-containing protein 2-like [Ptychodera flava]|uniref:LOW QUALITY PROTEIN: suppressor APC domain-containing protein 2-like n=1 Tax=Ptychodera flava TaxID=63121 RepID=UPI00396A580A